MRRPKQRALPVAGSTRQSAHTAAAPAATVNVATMTRRASTRPISMTSASTAAAAAATISFFTDVIGVIEKPIVSASTTTKPETTATTRYRVPASKKPSARATMNGMAAACTAGLSNRSTTESLRAE